MSIDDTFDVIRWYDPEIVAHNTAKVLGKYSHERDISALKIPPEATPIIFTCRLLERGQRRLVRRQPCESDQYDMAFRLGVVKVTNLPGRSGAHVTMPARARPDEPLDDDTMDSLGLSEDDEQEIGSVIKAKSFLARGVPLSCPQLASSVHAYSVGAVRLAELKRASQTQQDDASDD
jgi:hypothetical protein